MGFFIPQNNQTQPYVNRSIKKSETSHLASPYTPSHMYSPTPAHPFISPHPTISYISLLSHSQKGTISKTPLPINGSSQQMATYIETSVNFEVAEEFKKAYPELEHRYNRDWKDCKIEKLWVHSSHVGHTIYQVHVKLGEFPNHHHYSVLYEINHGVFKVLNVAEGLKTLF